MNPEPPFGGPREAREYETSQLIPYLGNKRSLVGRLRTLFLSLSDGRSRPVFLDPFAGAGSVSRTARTLGMRVRANDWEPYAYALNRVWLTLRKSDLGVLFEEYGGLSALLGRLNDFHPSRGGVAPEPEPEPYMALWYAPRDTARADWRSERLFYTRENAVFLDRVREFVARLGPQEDPGRPDDPALPGRRLLLALLILEAAVHANTSGVFKAYHKGFGGHGRDALPRILGAMELESPVLPENEPAEVFREDALRFVRSRPADLAYLDPPYNQHQYGSNYHLLNTLVRWDREPVPLETRPGGGLARKAGISPAWKETRSPFCGKSTARDALASLIDGLDVRTVVFSYNTEGIVSPEELFSMLSERWDVRVEALDYVRYRGGRQSSSRRVRNHELVYVGVPRRAVRPAGSAPARFGSELRLRRLLASRFDPALILRRFEAASGAISVCGEPRPMWRYHRFRDPSPAALARLGPGEMDALSESLEACEVRDHARAVEVLAEIARGCRGDTAEDAADRRAAASDALSALRKLAHPRYLREFEKAEAALAALTREYPDLEARLGAGLGRLQAQRAERLRYAKG